jgi:hypothetical protein
VTLTYAGKLAVNQLCPILMLGANNRKPMEVVGLQLRRPQVFWGCYKEAYENWDRSEWYPRSSSDKWLLG